MFPQPGAAAAFFFQNVLEQVTVQFLELVHQKDQHHQRGKHNREILVPISEVVLKMTALVLQGVKVYPKLRLPLLLTQTGIAGGDLRFFACNDDTGGTKQSAVAIRATGKKHYIKIGQP